MLESLFGKIPGLGACNVIKKETSTQVFSYEIGEILKNSIFTEDLQ